MGDPLKYAEFKQKVKASPEGKKRGSHIFRDCGSVGRHRASQKPEYRVPSENLSYGFPWTDIQPPLLLGLAPSRGEKALREGQALQGGPHNPWHQTSACTQVPISGLGPDRDQYYQEKSYWTSENICDL